jgi:hypothetical protein
MTYLGHNFSFASDAALAKEELLKLTKESIALANKLPITPLLKCHALNLQLRAKLSFVLSHYTLGCTWIKNSLDTLVTQQVRSWLNLPPCATSHFIPLSNRNLGLDLILPSMLFELCQTSSNISLVKSQDPKMPVLYRLQQNKTNAAMNIEHHKKKKEIMADIKKKQTLSLTQKLGSLKVQSLLHSSLTKTLAPSELESWSKHIAMITPSVANFARKALIRCLPTNSNLYRWQRAQTDACPHCHSLETENHVLNNCNFAATQGRYTWRHNAVLKYLVSLIQTQLLPDQTLYVDLPGFQNPNILFTTARPDIAVAQGNSVSSLELTCCYEKNLESSKLYKASKYQNLRVNKAPGVLVKTHSIEVSSLGFVNDLELAKFCRSLGIPVFDRAAIRKMGEISLRCSFFIFCNRHKPWPPDICDPYVHT